MGLMEDIFSGSKEPRPKFRKGDKVKHKLNDKKYIVINTDHDKVNFVYTLSDGNNKIKLEEPFLELIKDIRYY